MVDLAGCLETSRWGSGINFLGCHPQGTDFSQGQSFPRRAGAWGEGPGGDGIGQVQQEAVE